MDKHTEDAKWVQAYLAGNSKAFEKLYKRYERPLFSFILRFAGDRSTAEDLFQQTWVKVIKGLPRYQERGSFSSWVFGIAHNCSIDQVRKKSREKIDDFASNEGLDRIKGASMNPENQVIQEDNTKWLQQAIERLPEDQKEVVMFRLYGEMPFREIAEKCKCPVNTVLGRMHYAVRNLRKMKKNELDEDIKNVLS